MPYRRALEKMGGIPTLRGWRLSVDSVVENYQYGSSAEEIADWFQVPVEDIRTILSYAENARDLEHARAV